MFKKSAVVFGRCAQDCLRRRVVRPNLLVRSHHLANFKNAGIQDQRLERRIESPKKLEDGSVGIIHVQGQESAHLVNPMQRQLLNDLELQQNRWLKEEKKNQDDVESLTKQITMSAGGGKDKSKDKCKGGDDKKKKEEAEKKKCAEMEQKKKCEEAAKKADADKKKKEQEKKCKDMAEKEKCKKMAADAKKKEADKKKKEQEKKCKEMAEKEKCKKLAEGEKGKKGGDKK
ncbi:hypothetical protein KR038_001444 [Drosophila bunnanda]|nr:hypothetical protein KR038_001444 [Drosophila bunnanda]